MATLEQSLVLKDRFSSTLQRVNQSMMRTTAAFDKFNQSVGNVTQAIDKTNAGFAKLDDSKQKVIELDASIRRLGLTASKGVSVPKVSVPKAPTSGVTGGLGVAQQMLGRLTSMSRLLNFQVAIQALQAIGNMLGGLIGKADKFVQTMARLSTIGDATKSGQELTDSIMAAATRSRSAFGEMADSVAKLRSQAGEAFGNNDEAIAFAEQLNKLYKIGGASAEQQAAGTLQITQALASGVLRGDEFNSMMENAPMVAQKLAQYLGVGVGELRNMAKEGQLTGDALKNALLSSAVETNNAFASMPMTFSDMVTQIKNVAMYAFQPLVEAWQNFISSTEGQMVFQGLQQSLFVIADVATSAFNILAAGAAWVAQNMDLIALALAALAITIILFGAIWVATHIPMIMASMALLAPYIILAGIILIVITMLQLLGVSALDVAALIIAGIVFVGTIIYDVVAIVVNIFMLAIMNIVSYFSFMWNTILTIAEFFINVWKHPIYSVKKLFYNLVKNVLNYLANIIDALGPVGDALGTVFVTGANIAVKAINWIIRALNMIPGVSLGEVSEFASGGGARPSNSIRNFAEQFNPGEAPDDYVSLDSYRSNFQASGPVMSLANPMSMAMGAFNGVKDFGATAVDQFSGFQDMLGKQNEQSDLFNQQNALGGGAGMPAGGGNIGDKLGKGKNIGNVGKVEDEVKLKDEDIKMMRDIAERQYVIDYQVLTPQVSVHYESNNNATEQDIDELVGRVEEKIVDLVGSDLGIA